MNHDPDDDGGNPSEASLNEIAEPAGPAGGNASPEGSPRDAASGQLGLLTDEALATVEAMLFAAGRLVTIERLAEAAELPAAVVTAALERLDQATSAAGRGIRLDRAAGGVRFVSRNDFDYPVRRLLGIDGKTKLSIAALETLAIIAYRQPVTGPEITELRGVNSSSSIRTLLDRKLITTAGRKEVVGTPFLYKTTKEFMVHFGLSNLGDLPKPEELEAIYGIDPPHPPEPAQTELFPGDPLVGSEVEPISEALAEAAVEAVAELDLTSLREREAGAAIEPVEASPTAEPTT